MVVETSVLGGLFVGANADANADDNANADGQPRAPRKVLNVLSPMDTVVLPFGLDTLWIFPPLASGASYDLARLRAAFDALVREDYPILDGALEVDEASGTVTIVQAHDAAEGHRIPFEVVPASDLDTEQAVATQAPALGATRDPAQTLVSVKLTVLRDGGLAIGVNMSHTLMDGHAVFTFMTVWSLHYRGVSRENRPALCHRRELLQPVVTDEMRQHMREVQAQVPAAPKPETEASKPETEAPKPEAEAPAGVPPAFPPTTRQILHFTPEELAALKAAVTARLTGDAYVSTIDVVTAFLALLITQARGHGQDVKLSTGVNARSKFEPPLPDTYVGNVVSGGISSFAAAELAEVSAAALTKVARSIRESILRVNDAYLRGSIAFIASQKGGASALAFETKYFFGPDLMFTSWVHNGMYDADFGATPWFVGPPPLPVCDGMIILMEGMRAQPGIDAMVLLEEQAMHRLRTIWNDSEFVATPVA